MEKYYYVYILASKRNGTLYVGVTADIISRIDQHKNKIHAGFTAKYSVTRLVYYEEHETIIEAIHREKLIKKWNRSWKISLIEQNNPNWDDLYHDLLT